MNNLLQLRFRDAAETIGRFALNTTLGVGGLLDPAVEAGWEYRSADFGETLAFMGVGSGPYIIMPMLGPSTMRDGIGQVVDRVFHPLTFVIGLGPNLLIMGGGEGFSMREQYLDELEALEESSIDYYAVLRAAYFQQRDKQLEDNRAGASARVADSR